MSLGADRGRESPVGGTTKMSAGTSASTSMEMPASVVVTASSAPAVTLTVTVSSQPEAVRVVIETALPNHGTGDELMSASDGDAQVYSLMRARRVRATLGPVVATPAPTRPSRAG